MCRNMWSLESQSSSFLFLLLTKKTFDFLLLSSDVSSVVKVICSIKSGLVVETKLNRMLVSDDAKLQGDASSASCSLFWFWIRP